MHEFAEEGRRNFFDIIAITYQKGAKSSLYRVPAVPTDFIIVISAIPLFRASIYRATYCTAVYVRRTYFRMMEDVLIV